MTAGLLLFPPLAVLVDVQKKKPPDFRLRKSSGD